MEPKPQFRDADTGALQGQTQYDLSQQQTLPQPIVTAPPIPVSTNVTPSTTPGIKRKLSQVFAIVLTLVVAVALFFTWHAPPTTATPPAITQQNTNGAPSSDSSSTSTTNSGDIQVYVVGAVKHAGVYTLPADARIFQLLQAAGGTLPNANLVALNLAAKLTDGEEVYVLAIGEVPPTYMGGVPQPGQGGTPTTSGVGQPVNINTASADELHTILHVSSTTAQNIVNYRLQHGPYTSIDQLLQVISKSIYDRIKNMVTI